MKTFLSREWFYRPDFYFVMDSAVGLRYDVI